MDGTCILVLGMHRSGTSPVTRVLNMLGADLPGNLLGPSASENETGFWESDDIVTIHDRFLSAIGSSWHDPRQVTPAAVNSDAGRQCRDELAAVISRDFSDSRLFVIKDPRMARLMPLWAHTLDELNLQRVAVIPLRNPLAVADSLAQRNGFSRDVSLALWLRHVLDAEAASRSMTRAVISYDALLADPEGTLQPLCAQLGCFDPNALDRALPQIRDYLSGRYRHHLHDDDSLLSDLSVPVWVRQTFSALRSGDSAQLDGIAGELNRSMDLFGNMAAQPTDIAADTARVQMQADHDAAIAALEEELEALRIVADQADGLRLSLDSVTETLEEANQRAQRAEMLAEQYRQQSLSADQAAARQRLDAAALHTQMSALTAAMQRQANIGRTAKIRRGAAILRLIPALMRGLLETDQDAKGGRAAAVLRYLLNARRRDLSPHPLMDVEYYLRENPDVAASGFGPVNHYLTHGWREGRKPHPLFDTQYYLDAYADVRGKGINPLLHYLRHGWRERRNPNAWFDAAAYERISGCRGNPLLHYLREGAAAGLSPSPLFNAADYLANNPDIAERSMNPLIHYLEFGRPEGRDIASPALPAPAPAKLRILFVTHGNGGGIAAHCADLADLLTAEGCDVWMLEGMGGDRCRLLGGPNHQGRPYDTATGAGLESLIGDLRGLSFDHVHYHHVIGFRPAISTLADRLGLPYDITVHDYVFACPRVTLTDGADRFCNGPRPETECSACIAGSGAHDGVAPLLTEMGDVARWRAWTHRFLAQARRVMVPDIDVANRLDEFYADIRLIVAPHPEPPVAIPVSPPPGGSRVRVAVIGGIGPHKGLHVLEDCARAALRADLPLDFVVFGAVSDDTRLRGFNNVTIHGHYTRQQLPRLLAENRCHIAAFLSIWPETYCYALSEALRAGLYPVAFDLGAQARRIKALGWGTCLPLETDPAAINTALICLAQDHPIPHPDQIIGTSYKSMIADYLRLELPE